MKTYWLRTALIIFLAFVAAYVTQWWVAAPLAAFAVALAWPPARGAFWMGFLALLVLWVGLSLSIHLSTGGALTEKMARLLPLGGHSALLIGLTGLVGGLCGGLCGAAGKALRGAATKD
jgi:hypothetical protein